MDEHNIKIPHSLIIDSERTIRATGISDVGSFDENCINLYTQSGLLQIRGDKIQVENIDIESGNFEATGKVSSLIYSENRKKNQSFLSKVFR